MGSSKKTQVLLLSWVAFCAAAVSCKPPATQTTPGPSESSSTQGQGEAKKSLLSKEQIIGIANREARRLGKDLSKTRVIYDDANAGWKRVARLPWPELDGHDYQAIAYFYEPPIPEGGLWILVDRKTGQVLSIATPP